MLFEPMTAVVIAANAFGAAMAVPQAHKLLRSRSTEGVSVSWAAMSASVNGWWGVYAIGIGDWSIVPVSLISVLCYLLIAGTIVRLSSRPAWPHVASAIGSAAAIAAVPGVALVVDGWAVAGISMGALYGIQLSPAVVAVYRTVDVRGVSLATWLIAFVEAALWGVYGVAGMDVGLMTLAGTGLLMSSLVLARLVVRRPRHAHLATDVRMSGFATA